MSVILRKRKNADGTTSLILDIYNKGKRSYEFLKHLKLTGLTTPIEKQANKDRLDQAKRIALKRAQELSANDYDMQTSHGKKTIVVEWMESYLNRYTKKDHRNVAGVINRFRDFLRQENKSGLLFGQLTDTLITDFRDYLQTRHIGEGAASYFSRFKKMMKHAYKTKLIVNNPAADVSRPKGVAKDRDVLTMQEIQLLSKTNIENENVGRAFIFSCMTGLRWVEVKAATWKDVNITNRYISVYQTKTTKEKKVPLNEVALKLLGKPANADQNIFVLPTLNGANKTVKAWVKRAGISKTITWHNARHSFGTNLVFFGTDLNTASNLLGHTTLHHTKRYLKSANELKERATDKLNIEL